VAPDAREELSPLQLASVRRGAVEPSGVGKGCKLGFQCVHALRFGFDAVLLFESVPSNNEWCQGQNSQTRTVKWVKFRPVPD
jgi:hypothetical protein